jgi:hypothetical protein
VALPPTASEEAKGALRTLWQMAAFHQLSRPAIRPARPLEEYLRQYGASSAIGRRAPLCIHAALDEEPRHDRIHDEQRREMRPSRQATPHLLPPRQTRAVSFLNSCAEFNLLRAGTRQFHAAPRSRRGDSVVHPSGIPALRGKSADRSPTRPKVRFQLRPGQSLVALVKVG